MYCEKILKQLELHKTLELQDCNLLNEIGLEIPFYEGLGFPPALIPVANSAGSFSFFGVYIYEIQPLKVCFVDLMMDESELYEIGLTEEQFCHYLSRRAMEDYFEEEEADIAHEILQLCKVLGVNDPKQLEYMSDEEFLKLKVFELEIPKYLLESKSGSTHGKTGFQLVSKGEKLDGNLIDDFNKVLEKRELQSAWNYLNSPGWNIKDAKKCFKRLVNIAENETLSELYKAWSNLYLPEDGY
jgi:hypothetical protein